MTETFELNRNKKADIGQGEKLVRHLRELNLDSMTGFEALKLLFEWQKIMSQMQAKKISH